MNNKSRLPKTIDLRITGECNLSCPFCFGPLQNIGVNNKNMWHELIDKFERYHVKCIVITGGEPSLLLEIRDVIDYAKKKCLSVILSSNGTCSGLMDICEKIDSLSLPLDGSDYDHCKIIRGMTKEDYQTLMQNMRFFKEKYPDKQLKIGTVVNKINMNDINKIGEIATEFADIWKLYQVSKHKRNSLIYHEELEISDCEFEKIANNMQAKFENKARICLYKNSERDGKYLFCEPNADAMVIWKGKELVIGNFITDFDSVLQKWSFYVQESIMERNILETYNIKI